MGLTANKDKKTYGRSLTVDDEEEENSAEDELHDKEARKVCGSHFPWWIVLVGTQGVRWVAWGDEREVGEDNNTTGGFGEAPGLRLAYHVVFV